MGVDDLAVLTKELALLKLCGLVLPHGCLIVREGYNKFNYLRRNVMGKIDLIRLRSGDSLNSSYDDRCSPLGLRVGHRDDGRRDTVKDSDIYPRHLHTRGPAVHVEHAADPRILLSKLLKVLRLPVLQDHSFSRLF